MMTDPKMALMEYLRNLGLGSSLDFLRESVCLMSQLLMELEVEQQIGAGKHERTADRTNHRNGYRDRVWETRIGEIPLRIPKLRKGSYYPSLLEPRRRAEKALFAVVQQAYIEGVSTRKVDGLLKALGLTGIDRSKVSGICQELDEVVEVFRNDPLEEPFPCLRLDALYSKVRQNHRIVSLAVVSAAVILVHAALRTRFEDPVRAANVLFFVLLLTLLVTLFDRYRQVSLMRFGPGGRSRW